MATLQNATVIAAIIAGLVGVLGLLGSRRSQQVERKVQIFADALQCIRAYQDLPYEVWRRTDDSPATKARLRESRERAYHNIQYHLQRLQIEAPTAARAYEDLFEQTRAQDRKNRELSWTGCIAATNLAPWDGPPFAGDNAPETDLCVQAMRAELRFANLRRLAAIRDELDAQRQRRRS